MRRLHYQTNIEYSQNIINYFAERQFGNIPQRTFLNKNLWDNEEQSLNFLSFLWKYKKYIYFSMRDSNSKQLLIYYDKKIPMEVLLLRFEQEF